MTKTQWELQVHAGNPKIARLKGLKINRLPECEGGDWYMSIEDATAIARAQHLPELVGAVDELIAEFGYSIPKEDQKRVLDALAKIRAAQ